MDEDTALFISSGSVMCGKRGRKGRGRQDGRLAPDDRYEKRTRGILLSLPTTPSLPGHATLYTQEDNHSSPFFVIAAFGETAHVFFLALRNVPNTADQTRSGPSTHDDGGLCHQIMNPTTAAAHIRPPATNG